MTLTKLSVMVTVSHGPGALSFKEEPGLFVHVPKFAHIILSVCGHAVQNTYYLELISDELPIVQGEKAN